MNDYAECSNAMLNAEDFKKFKHVYSGHFHLPSTKGNITYLGSPFQHTFNDVGSIRGYYIFDDGKLEFIEFTNAPKFYIITTNNLKENLDKIEGNLELKLELC